MVAVRAGTGKGSDKICSEDFVMHENNKKWILTCACGLCGFGFRAHGLLFRKYMGQRKLQASSGTSEVLRCILKILHDPKYIIYWE